MATIELGSNYDIEEDSNGDLVVKDSGGNTVLKHDESADEWKSISALSTDELNGGVTGDLAVATIFGERIESQNPGGVNAVEFTTGINSDYRLYILEINDLIPNGDNNRVELEVTADGGSTWETGASAYQWTFAGLDSGGGERNNGSTGDDSIRLSGDQPMGAGANERNNQFTIRITNPANTSEYQILRFNGAFTITDGDIITFDGAGQYLTAEAIDGVRIRLRDVSTDNLDNIEGGHFALYGMMS